MSLTRRLDGRGAAALLALGLPLGLAFIAAFWPTFTWLADRFDAADSFYSHGWLIPLASGWLIWQRRAQLRACQPRASLWGLSLLIPSLCVHVAATSLQLNFASGFAMLGTLWGLAWTLWGWPTFRMLRVPLLFLLFMIPLPSILLIAASFQLKLAAAAMATHVLDFFGMAAQQAGSSIHLPGLTVIVDDTCSGLRSLISLIALTTLWASLMGPVARRWHTLVVVAASVPIALAANMVRILFLVLISAIYGPEAGQGFVHYGSGFVVFGVALVLLAWLSRRLIRSSGPALRQPAELSPPGVIASRTGTIHPPVVPYPALIAVLLVMLSAGAVWTQPWATTAAPAASAVPADLGLWTGKPLPVSDRALEILETDDVRLMEYRLGNEPPLWFAQVAGFGNRAAFHPPELCYVGSHFEVLDREPLVVFVGGQPRQVMRLVLGQGRQRYEAWYWFTASGRTTPHYYQQQVWLVADAVRRRPMSGTLVRISTPLDDHARAHRRLLAFVASWHSAISRGDPYGS